jgi:hypothetical protein
VARAAPPESKARATPVRWYLSASSRPELPPIYSICTPALFVLSGARGWPRTDAGTGPSGGYPSRPERSGFSLHRTGAWAAHLSTHLNSRNRSTVEGEWFW